MPNATTASHTPLTAKLEDITVDFSKNPRGPFTKDDIPDLIASVEQRGVVQPVLCVETKDGLELVAGYRRYVASEVAKLDAIPIHIRDGEDREGDAITENMFRTDMTEIAEARALKEYQRIHGLSQKELAKRLGFDPSVVSGRFKLLRLPDAVQEVFTCGRPGVSVAPALEQIAKVSEAAAVRVAQLAAEDKEYERALRKEPRHAIATLARVLANERGKVKTEHGERHRLPAEGESVVIDLDRGVDIDDLALSDERRAELVARLTGFAETTSMIYEFRGEVRVQLDEADIDAFRALGVLLEYGEDDDYYVSRYCFDSPVVVDRIEQISSQIEKDIKERQDAEVEEVRAKAKSEGEELPEGADPEELRKEKEKADRAKTLADEKKKKAKIRTLNLDLGRRLLKRRSRKRSEKRRRELVRGLAMIVVMAEDHLAGLGPRLVYESWQDISYRMLKSGGKKEEVTLLEPGDATERLLKALESAKTLDDILDVIGDALVAATYGSEEELPMSRRVCGYSGSLHYARRGPVRRVIDSEASGVLPPELASALKKSKKSGYADPIRRIAA